MGGIGGVGGGYGQDLYASMKIELKSISSSKTKTLTQRLEAASERALKSDMTPSDRKRLMALLALYKIEAAKLEQKGEAALDAEDRRIRRRITNFCDMSEAAEKFAAR